MKVVYIFLVTCLHLKSFQRELLKIKSQRIKKKKKIEALNKSDNLATKHTQ